MFLCYVCPRHFSKWKEVVEVRSIHTQTENMHIKYWNILKKKKCSELTARQDTRYTCLFLVLRFVSALATFVPHTGASPPVAHHTWVVYRGDLMPWVRHISHCGQSMVPGSFTAARDTSVSLSTTWDHWDHRPVFPAPGEAGNAPEQCLVKSCHCFLTCQAGTLPPLGSGRSQRRAGEGGTGEHQFMLAFHVGFQYAPCCGCYPISPGITCHTAAANWRLSSHINMEHVRKQNWWDGKIGIMSGRFSCMPIYESDLVCSY